MRFMAIMRDRRGFVHKRIFGAIGGVLSGGGILGGIGGFLGGGGNGAAPAAGRPGGIAGRVFDKLPGFFGLPSIPISRAAPFAPAPRSPFPPVTISTVVPGAGVHESTGAEVCFPPFFRNPVTGECELDIDPGPGKGFPGGPQTDLVTPSSVCIETLVCPKFADNNKGVLWMNAMSGVVVCIPRGVNGSVRRS